MQVYEFSFRDARLLGVARGSQVVIPIAPICAAIGIDVQAQQRRIYRDSVLAKGTAMMAVPFGRGGKQEMLCLPLQRIHYWLAGIDSSRIKDTAMRDRVIAYQEECADVLCAYFMPGYAKAAGVQLATLEVRLLHDDLFDRSESRCIDMSGMTHPFGYDPDDP